MGASGTLELIFFQLGWVRTKAVHLGRDQRTGFLGPLCSVFAIRLIAPLEEKKACF